MAVDLEIQIAAMYLYYSALEFVFSSPTTVIEMTVCVFACCFMGGGSSLVEGEISHLCC